MIAALREIAGYQSRRAYRVVGYPLVWAFNGPDAASAWYERQLAHELLIMLRQVVVTLTAAAAAAQRA